MYIIFENIVLSGPLINDLYHLWWLPPSDSETFYSYRYMNPISLHNLSLPRVQREEGRGRESISPTLDSD